MTKPTDNATEQQESNRLLDMTQDQLWEEMKKALKAIDVENNPTVNACFQAMETVDLASRILRLCTACLQRSPPSQWAKYCYVTCLPQRPVSPLDDDPTGTLRLVYPSPPTIRQLRLDAGLDSPAPKEPGKAESSQ